jgi:plastocyanin
VPFVVRRLVLAVLAAFVVAALVAPASASAATTTIKITNHLSPAELSVAAGTTIRFVNADGERHRMRSQSGPAEFDSHNLEPGQAYSMKLTAKGTYTYLDERDDENSRYFGRIVVGGGGSSSGGTKTAAPTSGSASVSMAGRAFSPATVTISAGGSVTFRNDDDRAHTVTATDGAFNSGSISQGGSWKRTFKQAGTFSYLCAIHPEMNGKVVVKGTTAAAAPKPKPSPTPKPVLKPAATAAVDAEIRDFAFAPATLSVPVGSTVTWRNTGEAPHTVTAEDGSFDSDMIAAGGSWARTFQTAGSFSYVCAFHPDMAGTVTVTSAATAASPSPTAEPSPTPEPSPSPTPTPTPAAVVAAPPVASNAPEPAPDAAPVAARAGVPDGELLARIGIVGLLIGGAMLLFVRAVGGSARRSDDRAS